MSSLDCDLLSFSAAGLLWRTLRMTGMCQGAKTFHLSSKNI